MTPYEAAEVFACFEAADDYDEGLMWRVDMKNRDMRLFALCNDLFYWATADCEGILVKDIPLLRQTLEDLLVVEAGYELSRLFSARKRKLRPQAPCYKGMEEPVKVLFDACSTAEEREKADSDDADWWLSFAARLKEARYAQRDGPNA